MQQRHSARCHNNSPIRVSACMSFVGQPGLQVILGSERLRFHFCFCSLMLLCRQEIWPAETTPVEGNKDALDSAFLPSADPDMQDLKVCLPPSSSHRHSTCRIGGLEACV